jgi:Cdc6-like AAA superfamily ATPase
VTIDIHRQSTPYDELIDRLQQHDGPRTVVILDEDVITDDQLYRIADAAAGDARLAIGILRTAAGKADRENHERVIDDILLDAAEDARAQIKQKSLDSLTPHQRVVYEIVREHGPLGPSEIHERYSEDADDPRTNRTIRTYLSKMEQYNLLEAEGASRDREYSLVDSAAASPMQ